MGFFDTLTGIFSNKNAIDAANIQQQGIAQGYGDLSKLYDQSRGALTTNYTAALQPFLQNYGTATAGTKSLTDALGITGDPTQVQARFAATPGYQFALNQGNENVLRNAAATGSLNSGKTNIDLTNYATGLANQTYGDYVNRLMPFLGASNTAASGIGNIYTGLGSGLAGLYGTQGNAAYGADTSSANAQANAELANNAAAANMWGLIGNLGGSALNFAGGGGGFSSLANAFGGGGGGGVGKAATSMFSDERLKEDIEPVGELYDGTGVYRYKYIGDPTPRIGLIAQEVEEKNPDAVTEVAGFKAVDYGRATEYASKLSRFLEAA